MLTTTKKLKTVAYEKFLGAEQVPSGYIRQGSGPSKHVLDGSNFFALSPLPHLTTLSSLFFSL